MSSTKAAPHGRRDLPIAQIVDRYEEKGVPILALAKEYKAGYGTIRKRLIEAGVWLRTWEGTKRNPVTDHKVEKVRLDIVRRHKQGESVKELAAAYQMSEPAIERRLASTTTRRHR